MPCLNVNISRNTPQIHFTVVREGWVEATVNNLVTPLNTILSRVDGIKNVSFSKALPNVNVSFGIICSIGEAYILRFEKATLTWNDADNREGVTKYNTLIASGNWSLEEIEIEELL